MREALHPRKLPPLGVATWPHQCRRIAALAAILRPTEVSWGSVCSPNVPGILILWFLAINTSFSREKGSED